MRNTGRLRHGNRACGLNGKAAAGVDVSVSPGLVASGHGAAARRKQANGESVGKCGADEDCSRV